VRAVSALAVIGLVSVSCVIEEGAPARASGQTTVLSDDVVVPSTAGSVAATRSAGYVIDLACARQPTLAIDTENDAEEVKTVTDLVAELPYGDEVIVADSLDNARATGQFDEALVVIISEVQRRGGLEVDGALGANTWQEIIQYVQPDPAEAWVDVDRRNPPTSAVVNVACVRRPRMSVSDGNTLGEVLVMLSLIPSDITGSATFDQLTREQPFDQSVTEAIVAFQRSRGLEADGIAGAGTWSALLKANSEG